MSLHFPVVSQVVECTIDKAAQAAAQAAQAAALQVQYQANMAQQQGAMTQEQALHILQKFTVQGYLHNPNIQYNGSGVNNTAFTYAGSALGGGAYHDIQTQGGVLGPQSLDTYLANNLRAQPTESQRIQSNFSPFSPDPNVYESDARRNEANSYSIPHPSQAFVPGFFSMQSSEVNPNANSNNGDMPTNSSQTDPHIGASSNGRYGNYLEASGVVYAARRPDAAISRPSSGSTSGAGAAEREGNHDSSPLQDLNGTLASLDLDREKPWKSQSEHKSFLLQARTAKDAKSSP